MILETQDPVTVVSLSSFSWTVTMCVLLPVGAWMMACEETLFPSVGMMVPSKR